MLKIMNIANDIEDICRRQKCCKTTMVRERRRVEDYLVSILLINLANNLPMFQRIMNLGHCI